MPRLLTILMILLLAFSNGAAVATAICQHQDGRAHAMARESGDARLAQEALSEETAARAASDRADLADAAAPLLAGFLLPPDTAASPPRAIEALEGQARETAVLENRTIRPILDPPLA